MDSSFNGVFHDAESHIGKILVELLAELHDVKKVNLDSIKKIESVEEDGNIFILASTQDNTRVLEVRIKLGND